jgi:hypothetical protein
MDCYKLEAIDFSGFKTEGLTNLERCFQDCETLKKLDLSNFTLSDVLYMNGTFRSCANLTYILLKGFGENVLVNAGAAFADTPWGVGSDEARQSLIDSLITYSFDRAAAGYDALTITLSTATKNVLTDEEKAAITAKGFTIV